MWLILAILGSCSLAGSCPLTSITTVSASDGVVIATQSELNYRGDGSFVDHCWLISTSHLVAIKFTFFIYNSICHTVQLYERSHQPSNTTERFKVSADDVILSEFWLPGPVLIRCKSNGAQWNSGFAFSYFLKASLELNFQGLNTFTNPSAEIISAISGERTSHPDFNSKAPYFDNTLLAWSIRAEINQLVQINFVEFNTESGYDMLQVFEGTLPNANTVSLFNMTGEDHRNVAKSFTGSVTLVFRTDGSVQRTGFRFNFYVSACGNSAVFYGWDGRASLNSYVYLQHSDDYHVTSCNISSDCNGYTLASPIHHSHQLKSITTLMHLGRRDQTHCISSVSCTFSGKNIQHRLDLPDAYPELIKLEVVRPALWLIAGAIRFRAETQNGCPNTLHRCELRAADGSTITAALISRFESEPVGSLCIRSVVSEFSVLVQPAIIAGSVIRCRLVNGGYAVLNLPLLNWTQDVDFDIPEWTGRPPFLISAFIKPALSFTVSAKCNLVYDCGGADLELHSETVHGTFEDGLKTRFIFEAKNETGTCIRDITCMFSATGIGGFFKTVALPPAEPETADITLQPLMPWPSIEVIRFNVTSLSACPEVTHDCKLRTGTGDVFTAVLNRKDSADSLCLKAVTSQFSLVAPPASIPGSTIQCRLFKRRTVNYTMPLLNWTSGAILHIQNWTGRAPFSLTVSLTPAVKFPVSARCRLVHYCGYGSFEFSLFEKNSTATETVMSATISGVYSGSGQCIRNISCEFSAVGLQNMTRSFLLPSAPPESVSIQLVQPELWSLTGLIQFRAVSESACGSVRHQCELRTASGASLIAHEAQSAQPQSFVGDCPTRSLTSQFSVSAQPSEIAGSAIQCRLLNGSYATLAVPRLNWSTEMSLGIANWSGRAPFLMTILLKPALKATVSASCYLTHECSDEVSEVNVRMTNSRHTETSVSVLGSQAENGTEQCIRNVSCEFSAHGLNNLTVSFPLPSAKPESVSIQLLQPELWSLTGAIQFRAVSESACGSVRHQCELRTATGESFPAREVITKSEEPAEGRCQRSVSTLFAVVAELSAMTGSVIECLLLNGSSAQLELPLPIRGIRLARVWERPLLSALTATAALAIVALVTVGCKLLVMKRRKRRDQQTEADRPRELRLLGAVSNDMYSCTGAALALEAHGDEIFDG